MIPLAHNKLLDILARHQVPVVIIGGHAVNYHGHLRVTDDVDLIWWRTPGSEAALLRALGEVNACWISNERDPATGLEKLVSVSLPYLTSTHLMMLVTDLGFLDLFDYVPGCNDVTVESIFADSIVDGDRRYVSLSWLRRMKESVGRSKDIDDLKELE